MFARRDRDDTVEDVLYGVFLEHKAHHAEIQRAIKNLFLFVHCENDHTCRQAFSLECACDFEAGQTRQVHVEHRHVWTFILDGSQRGFAIAGLSHQVETRISLDYLA